MGEDTGRIDFRKISQTAMQVITSPVGFFRGMSKTGGFVEPLLFLLVMGLVAGLIQAIAGTIGIDMRVSRGMAMASMIMFPLLGLVFSFIGTAVVFVIWKSMGSQESYEAAYRCVGFLSAVWPLATVIHLIPFIGPVATIALWTYFYIIASIEVHNIPSRKAWLVFGIIGGVFMMISIGFSVAHRMSAADGKKYRKQLEQSSQEGQKNAEEMKKLLDEMQKKTERK